jgi:hypothetical protein
MTNVFFYYFSKKKIAMKEGEQTNVSSSIDDDDMFSEIQSMISIHHVPNQVKRCRLCCHREGEPMPACSEADRAEHFVYHVSDNDKCFWGAQGHSLSGEQILAVVRQTNARYDDSFLDAATVYVCERCFTSHVVIKIYNPTKKCPFTGKMLCKQCK